MLLRYPQVSRNIVATPDVRRVWQYIPYRLNSVNLSDIGMTLFTMVHNEIYTSIRLPVIHLRQFSRTDVISRNGTLLLNLGNANEISIY
jgi:hypothetical protein